MVSSVSPIHYDVMVVADGIAGMQASLDIADHEFKAAIVEGNPSIG